MHTNRLAAEKSPYLLQHAHNPVDWFPWGEEAFKKARAEGKPIFLSAGYSTCHWCHVMERESFENESVAALLNRDFVPIKLDREERPDVDRVYMAFVQATTGSGGWPLSVWLTPELQPFFGGTYFPPDARYGHPGFASILQQIARAWASDRAQIEDSARTAVQQLRQQTAVEARHAGGLRMDAAILNGGFSAFRRMFDPARGGFGGAPKFPRPAIFEFLLRHYAGSGNREALDMCLLTLREMAKGGMNDQLGGGFHRYSVDDQWFVPHFEKMLYDQAQLAVAYLHAFQITGEQSYVVTARRTLDFVLRDLTHREREGGEARGFYSAEDADSPDPQRPDRKREGAFYVWSAHEIQAAAGSPAAGWLCHHYGAGAHGNVAHDPHGEFSGWNILFQARTMEETARHFGISIEAAAAGIAGAEGLLLEARSTRPRPHLDDKILTAWNGLMISAFALGGAVLGEPRYAAAARSSSEFLLAKLYDASTGTLFRRYRDGEVAVTGFLEDYAFLAQALLDLYETQFDPAHLETAARLTERQLELFEDREAGAFYEAAEDPRLALRVKEDYDGAEPSGNSIAAMNLLRLARMTGRADFREAAERTLAAFAPRLETLPAALPQMLAACEFLLREPVEIVIAGERGAPDTEALLATLFSRFVPNRVVLLADSPDTRRRLAEGFPGIEFMDPVDGRASAYVCRGGACQLPVTEPAVFAGLLQAH